VGPDSTVPVMRRIELARMVSSWASVAVIGGMLARRFLLLPGRTWVGSARAPLDYTMSLLHTVSGA
jgi:hypothetical protein